MTVQFSNGTCDAFGFTWEPYVTDTGVAYFNLDTFCKNFSLTPTTLLTFMSHLSALMPVKKQLLEDLSSPATVTLNAEQKTAAIKSDTIIAVIDTISNAKNAGLLFASEMELVDQINEGVTKLTVGYLLKFAEAATGYSLFKTNHKKSIADFLQNQTNRHLYKWVQTFPDSFLESIFKAFNYSWSALNEKPEEIGQIIINVVFARLPQDTYEELLTMAPKRTYSKNGLNGSYVPTQRLLEHLISITNILKIAKGNTEIFFQLLNQIEPVHHQYLVIPIQKKRQEVPQDLLPIYELLKNVL